MGKPKYLEENLPLGPLSLPHLTNSCNVYMEITHDWWEKACSCYFGGGEKLTCSVVVVDDDDDDDEDAVSLQQYVGFTLSKATKALRESSGIALLCF
jgi:hypothetical protein